MGATFVGQNRVRAPASTMVCEPCVAATMGKPPDTERLWSHLVEGREHQRINKGSKPAFREFLRREHKSTWFAAIADSGQKHVLPWTPVNSPSRGGRVMFEETIVIVPGTDDGWRIVDAMTSILTAGATKEEVDRGEYGPNSFARCAFEIRKFELSYARQRTSPWFDLALWLAQRDEASSRCGLEVQLGIERLGGAPIDTRPARC